MKKKYPIDYDFFPRSFVLPVQAEELRTFLSTTSPKPTLIVKPSASSQGKGIFLTKRLDNIDTAQNIIV